jgi:hypothetical protein
MVCVLQAAQLAGVPFRAIVLKVPKRGDQIVTLSESNVMIDSTVPDFTKKTKKILRRSEEPVVSFVGGVKHISIALRPVRRTGEPPFDFILPEEPELPLQEGTELIPHDAVREVLLRTTMRFRVLLEKIAQSTQAPVFQVESPPPPPERLMKAWFGSRHRHRGPDSGHFDLPMPLVRYKLWRLNSQLVREHSAELGVTFVEHPPEAVDSDGFLREELVRNYTHANQDYGQLVVNQLAALQ